MTILVPLIIKPNTNPFFKQRCLELVSKLPSNNPEHTFEVVMDETPIKTQLGPNTPWNKVTVARNQILAKVDLTKFDYVMWFDADVIDYPPDLPTKLIKTNPEGVTAPWISIEDTARFYDTSAFIFLGKEHIEPNNRNVIIGRQIPNDPPFFPSSLDVSNPVLEMAGVGTVVLVKSDIYKHAKHENHPAYTDWFSICVACRELGRKVICDRTVTAVHANLPKHGEQWH
jgi:hypothetical protein